MNPLNQQTITAFKRAIKAAGKSCPLFAVVSKKTVMVTNGSVLLEWPREMVDEDCAAFSKLIDNKNHGSAAGAHQILSKTPWADVLFNPDKGKFLPARMMEPNDKELHHMKKDDVGLYVFTAGRSDHRVYYCHTSFNMIDLFVPNATYKVFRKEPDDVGQTLALFEEDVLVGASAPSLL